MNLQTMRDSPPDTHIDFWTSTAGIRVTACVAPDA